MKNDKPHIKSKKRNVSAKDMIGFKLADHPDLHRDTAMRLPIHANEKSKRSKKQLLCVYFQITFEENNIGRCINQFSKHFYTITTYGDDIINFMCDNCGLYKNENSIFLTNKSKKK